VNDTSGHRPASLVKTYSRARASVSSERS
jgi:hypothetical protein